MDIGVKEWELDKAYNVDDIIRVGNLSLPSYVDLNDPKDEDGFFHLSTIRVGLDSGEKVITDDNYKVVIDNRTKGDFFERIDLSVSQEVNFGYYFPVNKNIGYKVRSLVKKIDENSETADPYNTFIEEKEGKINLNTSIGVGVGIRFYDQNQDEIKNVDRRKTTRLMASSELSHKEYYNVQIDIRPEDIPSDAVSASAVILIYGLRKGGFTFRKIKSTNLSEFFYCTKKHTSSLARMPNANGDDFWTQDFKWRPSYGSKSDFTAINDDMKMGEGSDYVNNLSINSLPMKLDVLFDNRTDKQAKAIMHFLQEKHFAYESTFGIDYKGDRLASSEVSYFNFIYTNPYREDLKFVCSEFSHNIKYRNNNAISARFVCDTESTLRSVESHSGFNKRLDVILKIFIDEETHFKKGEKIKLSTFPKPKDKFDEEGNLIESGLEKMGEVIYIEASEYDENGNPNIAKIKFREDQDLNQLDCISITNLESEESIYNLDKANIIKVIDNKTFLIKFHVESGSYDISDVGGYDHLQDDEELFFETDDGRSLTVTNEEVSAPVDVRKLMRCPEDCLSTSPFFPESLDEITSELTDPSTGGKRKRIIFLKDFRQLQLEEPISRESTSITVTPLSSFTLKDKDDFDLLIPAVRGRSSIYLRDPDRIPKFPWAQVRNLEHRPSLTFTLNATPTNIKSDFVKYYEKRYKKEINQNMSTFTVVFDQRDDEETLEILQFLESHLGYKKFKFPMPRPHQSDASSITTQSRKGGSAFYCPSWSHEIVYKNNHKITATFIESSTSINENLSDFKGPCYSAALYNPVTKHELCTFASVGVGMMCESTENMVNINGGFNGKRKAVDIVFVVDTTGSMTYRNISGEGTNGNYSYSKYMSAIDVIMKMVTSYGKLVMPGTFDYAGLIEAPAISQSEPPWPVDENLTTLIDPEKEDINEDLRLKGYDTKKLEEFSIKIEKDRVNFGLILMGHGNTPIDLSIYPQSFDKKIFYDTALAWRGAGVQYGQGEFLTDALSKAVAQLYNSPRAQHVSDRIIVVLSDGVLTTGDWRHEGGFYNRYSPTSLNIAGSLRKGGALSKRRPSDAVLGDSSYAYGPANPLAKLNEYENQNNPETEQKPEWYSEEVPTILMFASVGSSPYLSSHNKKYVYDYDPNKTEEPQFHFPISAEPSKEVARLLSLVQTISRITSDTGYENLFCVRLKNCGPNPIKILNTIVNLKNEPSELKWTTSVLNSGIPRDGNYRVVTEIEKEHNIVNIKKGYGGQFHGDPNNVSFFQESAYGSKQSNTLWENFNTEYEVIRNGEVFEINGGWHSRQSYKIETEENFKIQLDDGSFIATDPILVNPPRTRGVYNTGVAFRGMPIRLFKTTSELEIVDYNIGGVDLSKWDEGQEGNYDHLPILQNEEVIDLFFGLRIGSLRSIGDTIELVFNTQDMKHKKMDCYGKVEVPVQVEPID
jgi:phage-related protein